MNIKDVYDDAELKQFSPNLTFLKAVDQRTGLPLQADADRPDPRRRIRPGT
jgi:hypothetical protein